MGIFNIDSPIMQGLNKIFNCVYLSLIWLIFSLPIITIGASTTALYYTSHKVIKNNRGYVFQQFWHSFKTSFKQSTIMWIIFLAIALLLYYDGEIMLAMLENSSIGMTINLVFKSMILIACMWIIYVLAYIARFSAPLKVVAKNAAFMAVRHLPKTILILLLAGITAFFSWFIPILILIVPTLGVCAISFVMESIFKVYMSEEDREKEEKLNGRAY